MDLMEKVSHVGLDNRKNFSRLTARDANNRVLFRQHLDHGDRRKLPPLDSTPAHNSRLAPLGVIVSDGGLCYHPGSFLRGRVAGTHPQLR